ncbi:MAG: hypothetical protein MSL09_03510 [Spirochaetia bacterium]|nr:hypothetical protein [Spirochaetia bacterium]
MSTSSHAELSSQDLSYMLTMPIPQLVAKMAIPFLVTAKSTYQDKTY